MEIIKAGSNRNLEDIIHVVVDERCEEYVYVSCKEFD